MDQTSTDAKRRSWLGIGTGILLLLSSGAHAFLGWPQLVPLLESSGVDPELIAALAVGWYFGSMAMVVFALIVLRLAAGGRVVASEICWVIGGGYLLFGTSAYLLRDFNPHFLLFIFTGLLLIGCSFSLLRNK